MNIFIYCFCFIFFSNENINFFYKNFNSKRSNNNQNYFKSVNIIAMNKMVDCFETLNFMKRNYHLNLFFHEQIDYFFDKCEYLDLEF